MRPRSLRFQRKRNDKSITLYLAARKDNKKQTNKMTKMFDLRVMCVNSGVVALYALHSMLFGG
jgi:ribosomal protein L44E